MKILHVSPSYYPATQFGGPIQSVHLLNKELVAQGAKVDVFTTNAGLEQLHQSDKWEEVDNLRVKYFTYYGYVHYNFSPKLFCALAATVQDYDLVHITAVWNFPVWAASFACHKAGVPYIISPRGTIYPETIALKSASAKKLYYSLIAEKCLTRAAAIHYTAQDEQDKVTNYLKLKVPSFIIPNGINLSSYDELDSLPAFNSLYSQLNNQPYLLFLGRISAKKGIDILIRAYKNIVAKYPDYYLVIVGPNEEGYQETIENLVREHNLTNRIIFTGMLEGDKKLAAYRDASAFILPSHSENFGMSVVEAMACGTPVIISDKVGISSHILSKKAGIITTTDTASVVEGIEKIISNSQKGKELSKAGRQMVIDKYGIEAVALKFRKAYQEVITNFNRKS